MDSVLSRLKGELIGFTEQVYKGNVFKYAVTNLNGNLYENLVSINGQSIT